MNSTTHYPTIAPVPAGEARPFWSVMIPTYNCAKYLRETLQSVLAQDPGADQMQIEVVDDCSTRDDPEAVVREVAGDRVSFFRQPKNGGVVNNFNTCIARARGRWVHILHGDDCVSDGLYAHYRAMIERSPDAALVFGTSQVIDAQSQPIYTCEAIAPNEGPVGDFRVRQATQNWVLTPSVVVARRVYEQVGGFVNLGHTADWEMWHRVGSAGEVLFTPRPLSRYRDHAANDTSALMLSGKNIEQVRAAIDVCCSRLGPAEQDRLPANRYAWAAHIADSSCYVMRQKQLWQAARIHAWWALRLAPTARRFVRWLRVTARGMRAWGSSQPT